MSFPWPVTVAQFRARFGAQRNAEKSTIWLHEGMRQRSRLGARINAEKNTIMAHEERQKRARFGARRNQRNTQNMCQVLHEEMPKQKYGAKHTVVLLIVVFPCFS